MTTSVYRSGAAAARRFLFMLVGSIAILPLIANAQFGEILGPGYPDRRFHMMALEQCGPAVRGQLYDVELGTYKRQLRAVRSAIVTLREAVVLVSLQQEQNLVSQIPTIYDREDVPVAFYAQQFLEGVFDTLKPTSLSDMIVEMLDVLCQGTEREVVNPEGITRFRENIIYLKRRFQGVASPAVDGFVPGTGRPAKLYKKFNGGAPLFVLKRTRDILRVLITILGKLRLVRFRPLSSFAKAARRVLDAVENQFEKLNGRNSEECGERRLQVTRAFRPKVVSLLNLPFNLLGLTKWPLRLAAFIMSQGISNDIVYLNGIFEELLERQNVECEYIEYDIPRLSDGGFFNVELLDFYDGQIALIDSWLVEFDEATDRERHLQNTDAFDAELAAYNDRVLFLSGLGEAITSIEDNIGALFDEHIRPYLKTALVDLPNFIESVTTRLSRVNDIFNPFINVLEEIVKYIPDPPFPFGNVLDLFDTVVCKAVDAVFFGGCTFLEETLTNALDGLLDDVGLFDIPDPDITFEVFDNITFGIDLLELRDDFVNLTAYLPDNLAQYATFFDPESIEDAFRGIVSGFAFSPARIYDKYNNIADVPGIPSGIESGSFFSDETTVGSIACPSEYTPVMAKADFFVGNCYDNLVGRLRFPCATNVSECSVDVSDLLFCEIPEYDEIINGYFGAPRFTLSLSYFCFANIDDWKIVPLLNEGKIDVELEKLWAYRDENSNLDRRVEFTSDRFFELVADLPPKSVSPENILRHLADTYQRRGYGIKDIDTDSNMDCSRGDRRIHLDYLEQHVDPCLNGHGPYPYNRQLNRVSGIWGLGLGFTDLCGYKVMFDNDILTSCPNHDLQRFSDQHPFTRNSVIDYPVVAVDGRDFARVCWEELDNLEWNSTTSLYVPKSSWEIDWEKLASNLEICEVWFFVPIEQNVTAEDGYRYEVCPFFNYPGIADTTRGFSERFGSLQRYCSEGTLDGILTTPYFSFVSGTRIVSSISCADRTAVESELKMSIVDDSTPFQSPSREEGDYSAPYLSWKGDFDDLNNRCLGENGAIETCLSDETNVCNLRDIGCLPQRWTWSCVDPPPTEIGLQRTYVWDQDFVPREPKTISCSTQNVVVQHYGYTGTERILVSEEVRVVPLELVIISAVQAEEDAVFSWTDITETVKSHCESRVNRSECILSPLGLFPDENRHWEIDSKCLCPAGFVRDPGGGLCVPCEAGFVRPEGVETCEACEVGTVSEAGSGICTPCPIGTFNDDDGVQSSCTECPYGTFTNDTGSYNCTECPAGTYQSQLGQSSCETVNASYYQSESGQNAQIKCPGGTFSSVGAAECTPCPIGSYSVNGTADQCELCPFGYYARVEGSLNCTACPQRFFADSMGASECKECPTGLTTTGAAASEAECIDPFPEELLRQIQLDGSDPNFGSSPDDNVFSNLRRMQSTDVPMEMIPDDGLKRRIDSVPAGCPRLLDKYLDESNWSGNITSAMQQIANGDCNGGPWNTAACAYDGGDCCPQTCEPAFFDVEEGEVISLEEELSSGQCLWKNFRCLDPVALAGTVTSRRCEEQRRRSRRLGYIEEDSDERTGLFHERRARILQDCAADRCSDEAKSNPLVGDGVCHPSLNNEESCWDGGDCCQSSCRVNETFLESCLLDVVILDGTDAGCAAGYGCCDPCFNGTDPVLVDIAPPIIAVVDDFSVECGAIPEIVSVDVPSFPVTVSDNDPCFVGSDDKVQFLGKEQVPWNANGACGDQNQVSRILFKYSASDDNNNTASKAVTIVVQDTLAPDFGDSCEPVEVEIEEELETAQLPVMVAMDQCQGEIEATFSTSDTNVTITQAGVVTPGNTTEFNATATVVDSCNQVATCDFLVTVKASKSSKTKKSKSKSQKKSSKSGRRQE